VFEDRVLRRIYGTKRGEVVGFWRRLHSEELHNLYPSPNVIGVIKSRRIRYRIMVGNLKERDHLQDVGIDGKILLEWILGK
jgi:hypothetical protein